MDWNRDGKIDSKDAFHYHMAINPTESKNENHSPYKSTAKTSAGGMLLNLVCLSYLGVLLPGDISINNFTMIIGLACIYRLGYCIVKWLG